MELEPFCCFDYTVPKRPFFSFMIFFNLLGTEMDLEAWVCLNSSVYLFIFVFNFDRLKIRCVCIVRINI